MDTLFFKKTNRYLEKEHYFFRFSTVYMNLLPLKTGSSVHSKLLNFLFVNFADQSCDVAISLNGLTKTLTSAYTYNSALTPTITGVNPRRGGTGGGTTLTVSGSGFG